MTILTNKMLKSLLILMRMIH